MRPSTLILILFAIMMSGCATPYAKFYKDSTGGVDITAMPDRYVVSSTEPKLYETTNPDEDYLKLFENNYDMIGYSSFNAANVDPDQALMQGKKVHAEIVLVYTEYTHTKSGTTQLSLPNTTTSSTTMSGTAYGPAGMASYSGTAYTTSYGTKTTY